MGKSSPPAPRSSFGPSAGDRSGLALTDLPVDGGRDTLMKTAHPLTNRRHGSTYGSVARHISDLSDLDRNYFVLLGGQDGFLGSTTLLDQVPLWQRGEYIVVPLRPETARAAFEHRTVLTR